MMATSKGEKRRIARELGIDINDLSLLPNENDILLLNTPARRNIKFSQLQAYAYPEDGEKHLPEDSRLDESCVSNLRVGGKIPSQVLYSPMSTPRQQTYN